MELEKKINMYFEHKQMLDTYKKACDIENTEIKKLMNEQGLKEFITDFCKATYYTQERTSFDEEKAVAILQKNDINSCLKTVVVVDSEQLESMIYNRELPDSVLAELATCNNTKLIPTLKVSAKGGKR